MARRHHRVQTIYTVPSHNASLCQDDRVIRVEGVGGWTARYRSRNSPETKRLFFAATEEMCACSLFIQSNNRPRLPLCLCPGGSGWVCSARNSMKFQIGSVSIIDFDFDLVSVLTCNDRRCAALFYYFNIWFISIVKIWE